MHASLHAAGMPVVQIPGSAITTLPTMNFRTTHSGAHILRPHILILNSACIGSRARSAAETGLAAVAGVLACDASAAAVPNSRAYALVILTCAPLSTYQPRATGDSALQTS
jgi:hypothetical protein